MTVLRTVAVLCARSVLTFFTLLIPLLPSFPLQNSPTHSFLPASRPSQLLAPPNRGSGAQDFCTRHSACAQSAPHFHRRNTCPYLRPFCRRHHRFFFNLLNRAPAFLSAVTFSSAIKIVTLDSVAVSTVLFSLIHRDGAFRCHRAFGSCACLRSLLYGFPTNTIILSLLTTCRVIL